VFGAVELLGDQSSIPGQNGVGFGDASNLSERFAAKALSDFRQRDPFRVGKPQSPGNLVLRMRFSVARYSFRNNSSWLTEPVT